MQLVLVKVWNSEGEQRLVRTLFHRGSLTDVLITENKVETIFEQVGLVWFMREDNPPKPGEVFDCVMNPVGLQTQRILGGDPLVNLPGTVPLSPVKLEELLQVWEELREIAAIAEQGDYELVEDDLEEV